jgi:hypothetical protein
MQMIRLGFAILFVFSMFMSADAQCVMCKAVAEDSAAAGGLGEGLNRGILYLMAVPYVLLGALGYIFFRKRARG